MKNTLSLLLVLIICFSFTACKNTDNNTAETVATTEPTEPAPQWFAVDSEKNDVAVEFTGIKPNNDNEEWHGFASFSGNSQYDSMFVIFKSGEPEASLEDFMSEAIVDVNGTLSSKAEKTELKVQVYDFIEKFPAIYVDKYNYSFIVLTESKHSNFIYQLLARGIDVTCSYYIKNILHETTLSSENFIEAIKEASILNDSWGNKNTINPDKSLLEGSVTVVYLADEFNNAHSKLYNYDNNAQLKEMLELPSYNTHKYTYDDNGNLTSSEYEYDWSSAEGCTATVKITYNSHGDEETRTTIYRSPENWMFDDGEVEKYKYEYEYNEDGTIKTEMMSINNEDAHVYKYSYFYDDNGNIKGSEMHGESSLYETQYYELVEYNYDEDGNLIFEKSYFENYHHNDEGEYFIDFQTSYTFYTYIK